MVRTLVSIWKTPDLRNKILFTIGVVVVFRILAFIPIPGADQQALKDFFSQSQLLQLLDLFSGGTLLNFSIVALGLNPYINASIIMQLLTVAIPKLEELQKEGEYGRQKINQYTRFLTVPLSVIQSYGVFILLQRSGVSVLGEVGPLQIISIIVTMAAGTLLLMWLGELITEQGIGNGISILIFSGIIVRLPITLGQTVQVINPNNLIKIALVLAAALLVIVVVVVVNEGHRRILVQYARRVRGDRLVGGQTTHLPIRVNQAGVIPIIFAVSVILLPGMIGTFLSTSSNPQIADIAANVRDFFNNTAYYSTIYFILVISFTYFYTAVTFNPTKIADDLKKYGGFIPGIRPGLATSQYLAYILNRITLVGGVFLGAVAILPFIIKDLTDISTLAIGGTGLLIVVSVVLETSKQLESQLIMRSYEGFITK